MKEQIKTIRLESEASRTPIPTILLSGGNDNKATTIIPEQQAFLVGSIALGIITAIVLFGLWLLIK